MCMEQQKDIEMISFQVGKRYDKRFIKQVVAAVEDGVSRSELIKEYNMSRATLSRWLIDFGSEEYHQNKQLIISPLQKRSIVRSIKGGRMTIAEALIASKVKKASTIKGWMLSLGRENDDLGVLKPVTMNNKKDKAGNPSEQELNKLKEELAYANLKILALNTLIDVAEEQLKIPIRKKPGARQS